MTQAQALIEQMQLEAALADKAYNADALLASIASENSKTISRREKTEKSSTNLIDTSIATVT